MEVSVIITTKNEENHIANCLQSIKKQNFNHEEIEIIVVDNNSIDKTKTIAGRFTSNVYDFGPERSAQRNFGIKKASGIYVLYLDADMILSENVIAECVNECKQSNKIALYIPEKVINGLPLEWERSDNQNYWIKVRNFERSFYNGTVVDCVRFVLRDECLQVGCFDEGLTGPEDWDFDRKIRERGNTGTIYSPIYHNEGVFNLKYYLRKKRYYSENFTQYIQKWGHNDKTIRKQLGISYRLFGVFMEDGKWKRLIGHPLLAAGMYFLRVLVGITHLRSKRVK